MGAILGVRLAVTALAAVAGITAPSALLAGAGDRLVVNTSSGLAISGFDPVAYFSRQQAVLGLAEIELSQNGAVWRFHNEGNRVAFIRHPEVYTPQFGGYDPVAIDRETSVAGHPQIWAVEGERLYLFYEEATRAEFLADPARIVDSAARKWPAVARSIGR